MLRILMYGMTPNPGGIESFVMNYYRRLDPEQFHIDFVFSGEKMAYQDEIEGRGGRIYAIPSRRENLLRHMSELRKIAKGYDVIYFNVLSASEVFSVLAVKGLRGKKIVVHSHNNSVKTMGRHLRLRGLLTALADQKLACSREAASFMFGDRAPEAVIINNAIDINRFSYNEKVRDKMRKDLGWSDCFVVGTVGRLCYQKNTLFLLECFAEVAQRDPSARLVVIGDGEDRDAVAAKIRELSLEKTVLLAGVQQNVPEWMQAMDVFVLPSRFEGLGIVLIEAQAAGLPCLASDKVSSEAGVTPAVQFLPLEDSAERWADKILQLKGTGRFDTREALENAGYDINHESIRFAKLLIQ